MVGELSKNFLATEEARSPNIVPKSSKSANPISAQKRAKQRQLKKAKKSTSNGQGNNALQSLQWFSRRIPQDPQQPVLDATAQVFSPGTGAGVFTILQGLPIDSRREERAKEVEFRAVRRKTEGGVASAFV